MKKKDYLLEVKPTSPVKDIQEFLRLAKAHGKILLTYGEDLYEIERVKYDYRSVIERWMAPLDYERDLTPTGQGKVLSIALAKAWKKETDKMDDKELRKWARRIEKYLEVVAQVRLKRAINKKGGKK